MEKVKLSKRKLKLSRPKLEKMFEELYDIYVQNKIRESIKAIEEGRVYTLEEVIKEVETWK